MNGRMKGLDSSLENFREAGEVSDGARRHPAFLQHTERVAGTEDIDAELCQAPAKLLNAGFVVDTYNGAHSYTHRARGSTGSPPAGGSVAHAERELLPDPR